jgi:hypothetical protein
MSKKSKTSGQPKNNPNKAAEKVEGQVPRMKNPPPPPSTKKG